MEVTLRNTPGSMGGGVAFPGVGAGSGGGRGRLLYDEEVVDDVFRAARGNSGGLRSPKPSKPLSRRLPPDLLTDGVAGMRGCSGAIRVAGSRFRTRSDSRSSRGSCSHGPCILV